MGLMVANFSSELAVLGKAIADARAYL